MGDIFDDVMDDEDSEEEDPEIEEVMQPEERCFEPAGADDPGVVNDTVIDVEIVNLTTLYSTAANVSLTVLTSMGFPKVITYPVLKE